jgi:protein-L-isoaspartate(D-aspartate) O-methyltransferase
MDLPRHLFVEEGNEALAYADIELPLAHGQSMMSPKVEARLLQAVDIDGEDRVLEIGTGSGYLTALMASLGKHVTTVELHADLQAIVKHRLTSFNNIDFKLGDGSQNWPDDQLYDVIVLTGSVTTIPETYKQKLNLGGRLAVVAGQSPAMSAQLITRISESEWETESLFETDLTPLVNAQAKAVFTF